MTISNKHLVSIDATSHDPRVLVVRPPLDLGKDEALAFAAHLIANANTALNAARMPISTPMGFAREVKQSAGRESRPSGVTVDSTSGKVLFMKRVESLTAQEALTLAADVVACADPEADMLTRVNAVVANAPNELAEILAVEGQAVKLSPPMRSRLPALDVAEDRSAEQLEADGDSEAAQLRRMRR
jgi:hypothetical protein